MAKVRLVSSGVSARVGFVSNRSKQIVHFAGRAKLNVLKHAKQAVNHS